MDLGLQGKVAMVGGGSRGLGFNVARMLAAEGVDVSIASHNEEAIQEAGRKIEQEFGGKVLAIKADARSADDVRRWQEGTFDRFGGVDLLFTNTGGPPAGVFNQFGDDAWQEAFDLLVMGGYWVALAVAARAPRPAA